MGYKNPFEDPDAEFYGKKVKDYKIPERKETPLEKEAAKVPNLEGYIYVPKIKLYVAKKKSLLGLNWYKAHEELHKQGLQMLTIRQFIDFMLYLKQNKSNIPNAKEILDEILAKRDPLREEWLDAEFSIKNAAELPIKDADATDGFGWDDTPSKKAGELYISYNHRTVNGKLVAQNIEPLEECLMEVCSIDLASCNMQGLPTKKGKGISYYYPEEDRVARFVVGQSYACIDCSLYGDVEHRGLGVRAARKIK